MRCTDYDCACVRGCSGKDLKRQTLLELVDYVNNPGGQKIFTEALMPDIMAMVVRPTPTRSLLPPSVANALTTLVSYDDIVGKHLPLAAAAD